MMTLPSRRTILWALLAATVAVNCLPWVPYRIYGSGIRWERQGLRYEGRGYGNQYGYDAYHAYVNSRLLAQHVPFYIFVLTPAQVSLFAFWAAFGRKVFTWRLAYLLAVIAILTRMHLGDSCIDHWKAAQFFQFSHLLVQAALIVLLLLAARAAGVRLGRIDGAALEPPAAERLERFQFSLSALLWWVAGFAMLTGLWMHIVSWNDFRDWLGYAWWMKWTIGARILVALSAMWLVLGRRWWGLRLGVFVAAIIAIGGITTDYHVGVYLKGYFDPLDWRWGWDVRAVLNKPWYGLGYPLWIAGSLAVLRAAGFRWTGSTP